MISLDTVLHISARDLQRLDNLILELRILAKLTGSCLVLALCLIVAPDFVPNPGRIHTIVIIRQLRVAIEVEVGEVSILGQLREYISFIGPLRLITIKHLFHVLFAARMVFVSRPVSIKLVANLSILLLLVSLLHERMLQELWPGEALAWRLVKKALKEGLELGGHVVGELYRVLDDQVDQRVDTVRIKGRCAHKELVDDDSERPQVNSMVVRKLLDKLWSHIKWRAFDRGQYNRVR